MRVVGYARTSWDEQVEGGFASIEAQERELEQFAKDTGLALDKVHTDNGLAPGQATCAGLIAILDSMDDAWEAVLVTSPCRMKGIPTISFDPLSELGQQQKRVLIANQATAQALAKVLEQRKAQEKKPEPTRGDATARRREIAERLLRGREAGARAGKHQSGPAPFGYRRDYSRRNSDGVLLVPDAEEAEIVRLIFREYLRLRSMKRLIKLLDERGLRTRRGKRWSRAGVSWILKNDTYVGRVHFGDIRVKGRHESIVAPILFNKVRKLIRQNNKRNRKQVDGETPVKAKPKRTRKKAVAKKKPVKRPPSKKTPATSGAAKRTAASRRSKEEAKKSKTTTSRQQRRPEPAAVGSS